VGKRNLTIGVIAKSTGNPVFQAAKTGAEAACRDLGKKYGITIDCKWLTPVEEDAAKQAQAVEQLVSQGADGISVSCSNADTLTGAINDAVDKGVVVVTFDSDAPKSKRMAYYGINDVDCGRAVMRELAKAMGEKGGVVAILSGNQTAPNLNSRIQGVKEELEKLKDKGFTLKQVYYTKENPPEAAGMLQQVQGANPDIAGWAMVGGWPLFTQNALDNVTAKVVSVDTLTPELDYVKAGKVQALIGQDCYGWGYESVRMIVEKLVDGKTPANVVNNFELSVVTPANVDQFYGKWEEWTGKK
jgi:ribose transport system substrate-binding protein